MVFLDTLYEIHIVENQDIIEKCHKFKRNLNIKKYRKGVIMLDKAPFIDDKSCIFSLIISFTSSFLSVSYLSQLTNETFVISCIIYFTLSFGLCISRFKIIFQFFHKRSDPINRLPPLSFIFFVFIIIFDNFYVFNKSQSSEIIIDQGTYI